MRNLALALCGAVTVSGCVAPGAETDGRPAPLPEAVVALADPAQDLASARLLPEDNCYWYDHVGPVETTALPLLTRDGRPICTAKPG
jgi:hypothetical protein